MLQTCCKNHKDTEVRQRYIPTFVHQPIFIDQQAQNIRVRCSPTFYSTALNTEGYNVMTTHQKKQTNAVRPNTALAKTIYSNLSHQRRIQDLNPRSQVFYSSKQKWYDHTKQQMFGTIKNGNNRGYSRERKFLDLSSDPVFIDFNYVPSKQIATVYKNEQNNKITAQVASIQNNPETKVVVNEVQNQNKVNEIQKREVIQQPKAKQENNTKKDFHKNCVPQRQLQETRRNQSKNKRPQTSTKGKVVSQNPTFTVIRGNRIQNRL